ncbi:MAG: hypothetical protein DWQ36_02040 [Acidobacteria bacterium]|nr:MAG: hypothetical protein DWQ30_23430 [Acidobacteriota bacterium]REK11234.1 MAG: hypothetical protein DWQ36_02040 [Acidobacteriota bacterium]
MHDLRFALRTLRRRPLFAVAVVSTLAVGLGANATIFSVVDSVLLRSLPYQDPDRLVAIWSTVLRDPDLAGRAERRAFSIPDLADLRAQASTLQAVAGYTSGSFRLDDQVPERLIGTVADADYLDVLGVIPLLGSGLSPEIVPEDGVAGVLISHALWQRRFGGEPSVLGRTVRLEGDPVEIVGVLPAGFRGLVDASDVWYPLSAVDQRTRESRGARWLQAVGRLAPHATVEASQRELHTIFSRLEQEHPDHNRGYGAAAAALRDELVGDLRTPLLLLWGAVGAVLLIAAVNVINLLIVHLGQRSGDFAVSRALGASTADLLRRIASEALLLSVTAGVLGLGGAALALRLLQPIAPIDLPGLFAVQVGHRALGFALLLTLALGALVGTVAALRALRGRTAAASSVVGATELRTTRRDPLRSALLIAEVALATSLTIAAGLLVRSFWSLSDVDPGMTRSGVGFVRLDLGEEEARRRAPLRAELLAAARATAGVRSAALASDTPFDGSSSATLASPEGRDADPDLPYSGATRIYRHLVSPGYFETLGIPMLRGRDFDQRDVLPPDDDSSGPGAPGVAIVSASFAAQTWPGEEAIGERFYLGPPTEDEVDQQRRPWFVVVGVVADHRHRSLVPAPDDPADPDVFFALEQFDRGEVTLLVAAALPPEDLVGTLSQRISELAPTVIPYAPDTLSHRLAEQTARARFSGLLMTSFALLALLLAAIGIYGVVAYTVLQRRREVGIRMALGADGPRVAREIAGPALGLVAAGLGLGVVAALTASRALRSQLFAIDAVDLPTYLVGLALLLVVGTLAAALPARRASRVHPVESLRAE